MVNRRGFLASLAALTLPLPSWADVGGPTFLAACKEAEAFALHGLSSAGESLFRLPLPARGHAACAHPTQPLAVGFARRPGTFALVIDCLSGREIARLTPPEGRQFNGHGVFSADGTRLMTSEVVAEGSAGRIGLWDARDFRRIGEWNSGGLGPHDMKRLADGRLVVANGGIATDPGDRSKLNIATMRPNISLISPEGALLEQVELVPELHQNSIRHLALQGDRVAFAMQWEGDPAEPVPQLGLWQPGGAVVLADPAPEDAFRMKGYAGSIAWAGDRIAITSPVAGVVMTFDSTGQPVATHDRADICGVAAAADGGFTATDGNGTIWALNDADLTVLSRDPVRKWDNHLIAIS